MKQFISYIAFYKLCLYMPKLFFCCCVILSPCIIMRIYYIIYILFIYEITSGIFWYVFWDIFILVKNIGFCASV